MATSIIVYTDYVCPFCLLAKEILHKAAQDRDIDVDWRPFELRPHPVPTLRPEDDYLPRIWRQVVYPMAARMQVPMVLPRLSPQPYTRLAFEGFQMARQQGLAAPYNDRMLRAFFQEERDIGDPKVLAELAEEVGLDRAAYAEALATGRYAQAHQSALAEAHARGVSAVPTLIVGERRIAGMPTWRPLTQLLDEAESRNATSKSPAASSAPPA